jgi:hypothetical protein
VATDVICADGTAVAKAAYTCRWLSPIKRMRSFIDRTIQFMNRR